MRVYQHIRIKVFAADCRRISPAADSFNVQKWTRYEGDDALCVAMKKAGSWNAREIERRQRLNDICYGVLDGGRCVHYSWLTLRSRYIAEIGYRADLSHHDGWIYDCHTAPTHRGRALYPRVLRTIINDVRAGAGATVRIDVRDDNIASLRGIAKAGFAEVATLETQTLFSLTLQRRQKGGAHLLGEFVDHC